MSNERRAKLIEQSRERMREFGWLCQGVFDPESSDIFTYTVGISEKFGHPELFVVGVGSPDLMTSLLNAVGRQIAEGRTFLQPGYFELPPFNGTFAVGPVLDAKTVAPHAGIGTEILNRPFEAVQVYIPDPNGKFPWEDGVDKVFLNAQLQLFECPTEIPTRTRH
ncbi:DUF4262 domain-containing protein [Mesorhizobium sp. SP-1A]|uniref:DUF4262 domain-containing protein n=1 Tax=Mesorhizobium sp. SP-1A TaxID=3077840 RepID=UPI0028F74271|nr:DUF4262 domain-containing protein [Mesorhizobium sp. SP-1A]